MFEDWFLTIDFIVQNHPKQLSIQQYFAAVLRSTVRLRTRMLSTGPISQRNQSVGGAMHLRSTAIMRRSFTANKYVLQISHYDPRDHKQISHVRVPHNRIRGLQTRLIWNSLRNFSRLEYAGLATVDHVGTARVQSLLTAPSSRATQSALEHTSLPTKTTNESATLHLSFRAGLDKFLFHVVVEQGVALAPHNSRAVARWQSNFFC